ncbi:MAG: SDR family NAD(P)-dependent oxidoreductase [Bacteroidetes bacterium]|nr:SDR family NAD(P)-dependent oxidoreductase [Bacteroidota bacterium]
MTLARAADELLDKTIVLSYTNVGYTLRRPFWKAVEAAMQGKVCVVTGANSGLGKNVSLRLAALGAKVYMLCRNQRRGEAARTEIAEKSGNEQVFLEIVDLSSQASIRAGVGRLLDQTERLDVLINNAGVLLDERQTSADGLEMTFATNTLGYFLLTELLLPLLKASAPSRVLNVSSGGMYLAKLDVWTISNSNGVRTTACRPTPPRSGPRCS